MTPREKAFNLIDKFIKFHRNGIYNVVHEDIAKQYALIAVDEVIKEIYLDQYYSQKRVNYWQEVKQEIETI
jgi:hypothetical protein